MALEAKNLLLDLPEGYDRNPKFKAKLYFPLKIPFLCAESLSRPQFTLRTALIITDNNFYVISCNQK